MKTAAAALAVLALSAVAHAHPGVGIVMDSRGNLFYTDLHHVWRIAPDGKKAVAVPNVHTHELAIDGNDNLFGEHVWYEGDATKKWGHYVWKRSPDGRVLKIKPNTAGFLDDYGFVHDRSGTMYWINREHRQVRKRTGDGPVMTVAPGRFREPRWINVTSDGVMYVIDERDLVRVALDGKVRTVAANLAPESKLLGRHVLFGVWFDRAGSVYVADYAHRKVLRVANDGRSSVFVESSLPWGPTGGVFAPNGDLWLLEYSLTNQARVRRVAAPARTSGPATE
ncbi:MAG: hypothetical protein ACXW2X_09800 [Thermoanaerobaculia bacterium]